jgi:hypothetical protein
MTIRSGRMTKLPNRIFLFFSIGILPSHLQVRVGTVSNSITFSPGGSHSDDEDKISLAFLMAA